MLKAVFENNNYLRMLFHALPQILGFRQITKNVILYGAVLKAAG